MQADLVIKGPGWCDFGLLYMLLCVQHWVFSSFGHKIWWMFSNSLRKGAPHYLGAPLLLHGHHTRQYLSHVKIFKEREVEM